MATTFLGGDLKLIANKVVSNTSETLLPMQSFALNVESSGLYYGDSTQVFVPGAAPTATAYNDASNNYMTDNGGNHAWKPIVLDQHVKITFKIPPQKFDKVDGDGLAALFKGAAIKVADKITDDVFAKITAASFPHFHPVGQSMNFDKTEAGKAETALAKLVGAGGTRNLILNFDYFDALRDSLSGMYANPTNNEVLRNGSIPGICGFAATMRTSSLKSDTPFVGIATNMSGIALSVAAVKQVPTFDGEVEVAVEENTKIPLTFSVDYSKDTRVYVATVEAIYGIAVMAPEGILRLTAGA